MRNWNSPCAFVFVLVSLLIGPAVQAESSVSGSPSYSYVGFGYLDSGERDGPWMEVSGEFVDNYFARGSYARTEDDPLENNQWSLGVGYALPVTDSTDIVTTVNWGRWNSQVEWRGFEFDVGSHGYFGTIGLRSRVLSNVQLGAQLGYADFDIGDDDISYGVDAEVFLSPNFSFLVGVSDSRESEDVTFAVGIRLTGP